MDNRFHKCDQFLVQYLQEQDDLQKKNRLLVPQNKINENYFQMSGTSMATPIAAGLTALILEKNNELTPIQIKNILCEGAIPISEDKLAVGKGIINFHHSIHLTTILETNKLVKNVTKRLVRKSALSNSME